jgi:hypothetical protein
MDVPANDKLHEVFTPLPEKPPFLKTICIISMVASGLMILLFSMGIFTLFLNEKMINQAWETILQKQPQLKSVNQFEFFHNIGIACVYNLLANIISLIGVILMWRLNRAGFFIYTIAELGANFFRLNFASGPEVSSAPGEIILMMLIDLVFISMFAVNLKHMRGSQNNNNAAVNS